MWEEVLYKSLQKDDLDSFARPDDKNVHAWWCPGTTLTVEDVLGRGMAHEIQEPVARSDESEISRFLAFGIVYGSASSRDVAAAKQ